MKRKVLFLFTFFLILSLLSACQGDTLLDPKNPVTLTMWHNYGGQMRYTMDEMIDEFNGTIGAEKGIIVNVTSISGSATLHEKLTMAANNDPGAPELPDITTAYPKTALILAEKDLLVDLNEQFTEEELAKYVPRFIEEGIFDNKLYVFPTAKSTEVLFVNNTLFNRFAKDTDISFDDLKTFEGIIKAAELYYQWSDNQTPHIQNDGRAFYIPDSLFNLTQVGYRQLGDEFVKDETLDLASPVFSKIWDLFYEPMVKGHIAIFDGYASDLAKTGDIICTTSSTAGVVFFPPAVTYSDNTTEPVEYGILPYPTFQEGEKIAIQRGSGMCVTKSSKEKEYAAAIFLKWFTQPQQNLYFISSTGYLPVTEEAYGEMMSQEINNISDKSIKKLLSTAIEMQREYDFYIPPTFENIDKLEKDFENKIRKIASDSRKEYLNHLKDTDSKGANKWVGYTAKEAQKILGDL